VPKTASAVGELSSSIGNQLYLLQKVTYQPLKMK